MNELEKSTTYYSGDLIIRMSEDGILRVTSDIGIMSIYSQTNNSIIIESKNIDIMKLIDEKELAQLLLDSAKLLALENGGVDNWNGYDYSLDADEEEYGKNSYRGLREKTDEEITKYYKNYEER